jgi:hypothetical protein
VVFALRDTIGWLVRPLISRSVDDGSPYVIPALVALETDVDAGHGRPADALAAEG